MDNKIDLKNKELANNSTKKVESNIISIDYYLSNKRGSPYRSKRKEERPNQIYLKELDSISIELINIYCSISKILSLLKKLK